MVAIWVEGAGPAVRCIAAKTFRQRLRGIALAPPGCGVAFSGAAAHGRGMAGSMTLIGVDRHGTMLGVTVLRPGERVRVPGAAIVVELPHLAFQALGRPQPGARLCAGAGRVRS